MNVSFGKHFTKTDFSGVGLRKISFDKIDVTDCFVRNPLRKTALEAGFDRVLGMPGPEGTSAKKTYRERSGNSASPVEVTNMSC